MSAAAHFEVMFCSLWARLLTLGLSSAVCERVCSLWGYVLLSVSAAAHFEVMFCCAWARLLTLRLCCAVCERGCSLWGYVLQCVSATRRGAPLCCQPRWLMRFPPAAIAGCHGNGQWEAVPPRPPVIHLPDLLFFSSPPLAFVRLTWKEPFILEEFATVHGFLLKHTPTSLVERVNC